MYVLFTDLGRPAIVISPLIALMQDQCTKLNSTVGEGVRTIAVALNSATHHDASIEAAVWRGEVPLLYVSPERLASPGFMERLERLHASVDGGLAFVAVDEAHCICEWGHDFRKEYRDIGKLRENPTLRSVPIMGIVVGGCCGPVCTCEARAFKTSYTVQPSLPRLHLDSAKRFSSRYHCVRRSFLCAHLTVGENG